MTGPEHYEAAEHLLDDVAKEPFAANAQERLMAAQVHATLAAAAATALGTDLMNGIDASVWKTAAGSQWPGE